MTMSQAKVPLSLRAALAAIVLIAAFAPSAWAANVNLRIEGSSLTHFNGDVTTEARSVPGGADRPECRSNETPANFKSPNTLTAVADALGDANMSSSGTYFDWGTIVCSVNGEFSPDNLGGWYVRINQQDSTAPNGYVLATDPLSNGDRVVLFYAPSFGVFTASLEVKLPAEVKPNEPVTGYVDSYSTSTDAKSPAAGASISGGGATASSGADGSFQITFPTAGKYLVRAEKASAIRGSQWVTVAESANPNPVKPTTQKEINKQRRIAARAKCRAEIKDTDSVRFAECIRIANHLGRTLTAKEKRVAARTRCVKLYPVKNNPSRLKCVRAANKIGR